MEVPTVHLIMYVNRKGSQYYVGELFAYVAQDNLNYFGRFVGLFAYFSWSQGLHKNS